MTDISFDLRIGGGSPVEVLTGTIHIEATSIRTEANHTVLPEPTKLALNGGKALAKDVAPSPPGGSPAWAYKITVTNGVTGRGRAFLVQVPESPSTVPFSTLHEVVVVDPDKINIGEIESNLEAAAQSAQLSFVSADIADGDLVLTRANGQNVNLGKVEGEPGLPGPNAIPADEAVAGYLGTDTLARAAAQNLTVEQISAEADDPVSPLRLAVGRVAGKAGIDLGAQVVSEDQLSANVFIPGIFVSGVYTQQTQEAPVYTLFTAPFDCVITDAWMCWDYLNVPVDPANYLTMNLRKLPASTGSGALTIVSKSTQEEPIQSRMIWEMANATWTEPETRARMNRGDKLLMQYACNGTTKQYFPMTVTVRYTPL